MTSASQLSDSKLVSDSDRAVFAKTVLRAGKRAGAIALVVGLAACSTAPDWARPSLIYGDDAAAAAADPTEEREFPELADVPDKPVPLSTEEERRQAAEGLAADRERARYTDEVLRGGTEAPAMAPRSAAPAPAQVVETSPVMPVAAPFEAASVPDNDAGVIAMPARGGSSLPGAAETEAEVAETRAAATQAVEIVPTVPTPSTPVSSAPVSSAPVSSAPVSSAPVSSTSTPSAVIQASAAAAQPVASQPTRRAAVPAVPGGTRVVRAAPNQTGIDERVSQVNAAAAAVQSTTNVAAPAAATARSVALVAPLTGNRPNDRFEASSAPALAQDALEAAGPIVSSRYGSPTSTTIGSADPEDPVEVNLDALRGLPGPGASLQPIEGPQVTAAYANQGGPGNIPPYVVNFGHGSVALTDGDRQKVAQAAEAMMRHGSVARIVGHASSRTGDLTTGKQILANFKVSLDRATAVASELIRNGVEPSRVFVEAKGAAIPVYYESMPAGEAGNRRAEIFIE